MSAILATVVLISSIITLVIALPTRMPREVATPTKISLSQIRGGITDTSDEVQINQCVPVMDTKLPTELHIHTDQLNSYTLTGFSGTNCNDDSAIHSGSTELTSPIQLNRRKPICSFKLGKDPWPTAPVTISFSFERSNRPVTVQDRNCFNVCTDSWESKYPHSVRILEKDGRIANNYIEVFSGRNCEDGTKMNDDDRVFNGADLVALTQINQDGWTKAFRISRK